MFDRKKIDIMKTQMLLSMQRRTISRKVKVYTKIKIYCRLSCKINWFTFDFYLVYFWRHNAKKWHKSQKLGIFKFHISCLLQCYYPCKKGLFLENYDIIYCRSFCKIIFFTIDLRLSFRRHNVFYYSRTSMIRTFSLVSIWSRIFIIHDRDP